MPEVVIYGASDDLVEVEGGIEGGDEYSLGTYERWEGRLESPDGEALNVYAQFGRSRETDWIVGVENTATSPSWPIRFGQRSEYDRFYSGDDTDPVLIIQVPEGTKLVVV